MKEVVQEDRMGCGVACMAAVLDITYQEALGLFKNGMNRAETEGFYCPDIVMALAKQGKSYRFKKVSKPGDEIFETGSIIYVRKSLRYPLGHFLARAEQDWMDSWINFPSLPRKAGLRGNLPGIPQYIIFRSEAKK